MRNIPVRFIAQIDAPAATVPRDIARRDVVRILVSDRNAVSSIGPRLVVFKDAMLHAPPQVNTVLIVVVRAILAVMPFDAPVPRWILSPALPYASLFNKRGQPSPPEIPAGKHGLGNLGATPFSQRQDRFDGLTLSQADIKGAETKNGMVRLKLTDHEISLSPVFLASFTPVDRPPARRFANSYTRLFARYPGLEQSKLGKEGLTGMEKVKLGYDIASASANIAMTAPLPAAAAFVVMEDARTVFSLTRQVSGVMSSLRVTFGSWEKIVSEQQRITGGGLVQDHPDRSS